jgi:hypothetical protein
MLSLPLNQSVGLNVLNVTTKFFKPVITRNTTDDYVEKILERLT